MAFGLAPSDINGAGAFALPSHILVLERLELAYYPVGIPDGGQLGSQVLLAGCTS